VRALALLICSILLGAACADGTDLPAGWRLDPESASLVHADSGLAFPPQWSGMIRGSPTTYDSEGLNVSIGYNGPENRLALTLYVYPPTYGGSPDPEQHFEGAVGAAVQSHPGAQVERAVRMELPLGNASAAGFSAFLHWPDQFGEAGSFVILIPRQDRFLKVRATFALDQDREAIKKAWEAVSGFLRSLELQPRT
jgi:hypothetical protein